MRDPARIQRICQILARAWAEVPDQRLGQLIINLTPDRFKNDDHYRDPFMVEDDEWEKILKDFIASPK